MRSSWQAGTNNGAAAAGLPAVVLGGSANSVSVARSLASIGVPVYAIGAAGSPVRYSRSCRDHVAVDSYDFDLWLEALGCMPTGSVLLPCSDHSLELIAQRPSEIRDLGLVLPEGEPEILMAMLDKKRTYDLARSIGIAAPSAFPICSASDVDSLAETVSYPCLLKPRSTWAFAREMARLAAPTKLIVVENEQEFRRAAGRMLDRGLEMIISEIIPGGDDQLFSFTSYIDQSGTPLVQFTKKKLRQFPVDFGVGSYHISCSDPAVAELGLKFFRGVGLRGLAYVEFKRDARNGTLNLIECNHRFGASNDLARHAGIDLAIFTYRRLTGQPVEPQHNYRNGVRLWHAADDARAFISLRRRGDISVFAWLRSLMVPLHFAVFSWRDPRPTLHYHASGIRRRWRVPRRHTSMSAALVGAHWLSMLPV